MKMESFEQNFKNHNDIKFKMTTNLHIKKETADNFDFHDGIDIEEIKIEEESTTEHVYISSSDIGTNEIGETVVAFLMRFVAIASLEIMFSEVMFEKLFTMIFGPI